MSELRIPIDPFNPGQFFACCGLLELFEMERPFSESRFVLNEDRPRSAGFELRGTGELDLPRLLQDLRSAKWDAVNHPDKAVKPLELHLRRGEIALDWWFDWFLERTRDVKCWAGQVTTEKLASELLPLMDPAIPADELFTTPRMMKTRFGIDPRSAWTAIDVGFSPNEQGKDAASFPVVELLGAIGLQGFRPDTRSRADVRIHYWHSWLPRVPARRAALLPWPGLNMETYRFRIDKRGSYKYFTFASPLKGQNDELR